MSDFEFEWSDAAQPAPHGIYEGDFLGCEKMPKNEEYGEGVRFKFVIRGGDHDGKPTGNVGSAKPTANNATGRIIKGLLGKDFKSGDKMNLQECIGKRYTIVVQENKNNRPVVVAVQQVQPK